jgi:hypothetical protein
MGVTNFPNGLSSAGTVVQVGVTNITGAGTVTTGLDTVVGVTASLAAVPGTAGGSAHTVFGTAHANASGAASFILRTQQADGVTAGTVSTPVSWVAYGAKT